MEEDDLEIEPMEQEDPEEGFNKSGEQIIGEEDPEEDPEEDHEEDHEEDLEEDPTKEGAEPTHEVYFEEELEDPRVESRVLETKEDEHKDRVTAWKRG